MTYIHCSLKFFYHFQNVRIKVASNLPNSLRLNLSNSLRLKLVTFSYLSKLVDLHNKQMGQTYIVAKLVILWGSHTLLVNKLGLHRNQNRVASLHIRKKQMYILGSSWRHEELFKPYYIWWFQTSHAKRVKLYIPLFLAKVSPNNNPNPNYPPGRPMSTNIIITHIINLNSFTLQLLNFLQVFTKISPASPLKLGHPGVPTWPHLTNNNNGITRSHFKPQNFINSLTTLVPY